MSEASTSSKDERKRPVRGRYASVALFVFNTILLLASLELAVRWLNAAAARRMVNDFVASAVNLPYYRDQPWRETYWRESVEVRRDYRPYVAWRESPITGETLQIDAAGIRRTPGAVCEGDAYRVFAFGGSTMWGVGAPDWSTIPAYLQALLAQRSTLPICVVNFGAIGWVSTQSVVALLLELQRGHVPDLAIFYDGVNDVYAAYQNGRAGDHQNLAAIRARLDDDLHSPARELWEQSALSAFIRANSPAPPEIDYRSMGVETNALADEVISVYLANIDTVARLARSHGFRAAFVWQPFLSVGAKRLTRTEKAFRDALDPDLVALYRASYERARARSLASGFAYLADALDPIEEPLWIDSLGHLNPPGNERMAHAIVEHLVGDEAAAVALGAAPARRLFTRPSTPSAVAP